MSIEIKQLPYMGKPRDTSLTYAELSYSQNEKLETYIESFAAPDTSPLDLMIQLEEELGCSVFEALKIYRDHLRDAN
jgi:hypothetical protein